MQVKIVKCSSDSYWYKNHVNEVFDVKYINDKLMSYYKINNGSGIKLNDAKPINRIDKIDKILNNINKCKLKL